MTTSDGPSRAAPVAARQPGFPFAGALLTLIVVGLLGSLGAWQLQRRAWKEALLARIAALDTAAPQVIDAVLARQARGDDVDFTRVIVSCPGLQKARFLELYGLYAGRPGARLISACPLQDAPYASVLVDRGFIAADQAARPQVRLQDDEPVVVTGVLRKPDKPTFVTPPNPTGQAPGPARWYWRDAPAMAKALGAGGPVAPLYLFAEVPTAPDTPALKPAPIPLDIPNRHLEYALTWFGLAAAALGVYLSGLYRRTRRTLS